MAVLGALSIAGCAPYAPAVLLPSHPASFEAESASTYPVSRALDAVSDTEVNSGAKDKVTKDSKRKDGSTRGEMDHAGH